MAFRAAPDLYLWDGETIPCRSATVSRRRAGLTRIESLLSVTLNNTFLNNLPMNKQGPLEKLPGVTWAVTRVGNGLPLSAGAVSIYGD